MELADNEQQKPGGRRRSQSRPEETPELLKDEQASETEAPEAVADAEEDSTRQFVTFRVGDEVFGLPIVEVQEIIRLPDVTRVPLSSSNLQGLSNLRGKMLPIISLRRIFGFPDGEHDDATRVLVIQHESLLGFVVDQVASVISVEAGQIEGVGGIKTTVNTEYLTGIIKNAGGKMVMIVNFEQLMEAHFHLERAEQRAQRLEGGPSVETNEETEDTDTLHFVSFTVESQEYAIPIEHVQEIVQIPEEIAHVPNSASHVLGVISLRDRLLPLVSLRQLFALPFQPLNEQNRIVVIHLPSEQERETRVAVGIVTDTVNEVLRVNRSLVDDLPSVLSQDGSLVEITAIGRLDGGKRLVSFLSAELLLQHNAVREAVAMSGRDALSESGQEERPQSGTDEDDEDEKQVVIFRLGNEEYGVPIEAVNEIVRVPESLTRIPTAPSFVEGIINLRGSVLPVIDQRRRFGLDEIERSDRQRIMVFNALGTPTGFIVDSVSEVYKIADSDIEPTPSVSCGRGNLITEVANLEKDKRIVLLLDVNKLLDTQESAQVARLAA
jgi:purine-binding chemotaxis protein CheW